MEWLKKNIPKDGKKAGMKRFIVRLNYFLENAIKK